MKHQIKKSYIFLTEDSNTKIYNVKYDLKEIIDLINDYSIKSGATLIEKRSINKIAKYTNGRIIEERITKTKLQKNTNNRTKPYRIYIYKILEKESNFITTLLDSFKCYPHIIYGEPYILVNFSKIYDMLNNNELSENDILFMQTFLKELDIKLNRSCIQKHGLPNNVPTLKEDGIKNLNLLNEIKNYKKEEPIILKK